MSSSDLADVVRTSIAQGGVKASKAQWQILNAIMQCKTPALGGHLYRCASCNKEKASYNSCRNRHCPKCQGGATAKWLTEHAKDLLPVPYFHVVFTIPHELNGLVLQNKKVMYGILFKAVAKTLKDVAKSKLDGAIGFLAVLHTWGQKLEAHPHIHCVVPGVVIKANGTVEKTYNSFFLPHKVLKVVFRAVFLKLLNKAFSKLEFHGEQKHIATQGEFDEFLKKLTKKHWICYLKKPFAGPEAVLKYLARYTHRVAISNARIKRCENQKVSFSYKDYANNCQKKICTLSCTEFVRRFILHTLPKNFTRIRTFGFLGNSVRKTSLLFLKQELGQTLETTPSTTTKHQCPNCGSDHYIHLHEIQPVPAYFPHSKTCTGIAPPFAA